MQVLVRDNNVDQALKALKKKMQREGIFREMKLRRHFEKPSERRAREAAEAVRRARKMERKACPTFSGREDGAVCCSDVLDERRCHPVALPGNAPGTRALEQTVYRP